MSDPAQPAESESSVVSFVVDEGDRRLDKLIRDKVPGLSRTQGQLLIEAARVTVDGYPQKPSYIVAAGERVAVAFPPSEVDPRSPSRTVLPEPIPLDVIYEDEHLLVVNKPAALVVHPAPGHDRGTLVNALLAHDPTIAQVGPPRRAGIVHRLDKDTSGALVVAKKEAALSGLQEQFRRREVTKVYLALVLHRVEPPEGIIEVPIGRHPRDRQRMAARAKGKYARTRFRVREIFRDHTLLEVRPYTGRTHQVRVHLSWFGHPVVGDATYGPRHQRLLEDRHFLHAETLGFVHPATGEDVTFAAPLPARLEEVLEQLRPHLGRCTIDAVTHSTDRQEDR